MTDHAPQSDQPAQTDQAPGNERARRITDALREVYDPCCAERQISVVDMGLVRDVVITDDDAAVRLILTSGWCPFVVDLVARVRERVAALPEVGEATVEVVWDEAWTTERLSPEARRKLQFLPDPATVADRDRYVAAHSPPPRTT